MEGENRIANILISTSPALSRGVVVQPLKSWLMIEGHYAKG